jgi:hypothetical protein
MLDSRSLARYIAAEQAKEEMVRVERQCDVVLGALDGLGREPTTAERDVRRIEFLKIRSELGELARRVLRLRCSPDL